MKIKRKAIPCPYCNSNVKVVKGTDFMGIYFRVRCSTTICDVRGPKAFTKAYAIGVWNTKGGK